MPKVENKVSEEACINHEQQYKLRFALFKNVSFNFIEE